MSASGGVLITHHSSLFTHHFPLGRQVVTGVLALAAEADLEVEVRPGGQAGHADVADDLPALDRLARPAGGAAGRGGAAPPAAAGVVGVAGARCAPPGAGRAAVAVGGGPAAWRSRASRSRWYCAWSAAMAAAVAPS